MGLRRITGGGLVALMLLTIGLPAVCGECQGAAGKRACAENHDAATDRQDDDSMFMAAACRSCGDRQAYTAKRQPQQVPVSAFTFRNYAQRSCDELNTQSAAINPGKWSETHRIDASRETGGFSTIAADSAIRAVHRAIFGDSKSCAVSSPYKPLSVSLKI